jgi:divalent metal cation (Fe/Co/Zn/Cd) transporter
MEKQANKLIEPRFSDEKVVKTSLKIDILDVLISLAIALVTGSVVMLAKVLQGVSDIVVDGLAYIGMKRSKRMPTEKHPFGFGRELYIWSFFSTLIMFLFLASFSFYSGLQRFLNPEPISHIFLVFTILIISLLINSYSFCLSFIRILEGKPFWKIKRALYESTFLETKITFTSDLMGTLAATFGLSALIFFYKTGNL